MFTQDLGSEQCRTVSVPACDAGTEPNQSIPALEVFQLPIRDEVDFSVDFTAWIGANGNPSMTSAVFAVAAGSPKTPIIRGQGSVTTGMATIVLAAAVGAVPNDAYWLDVTAMMDAVPAAPGKVAIPARKLVRRIQVVVVNG